MMIPDSQNRLNKSLDELEAFLADYGSDPTLKGSEFLTKAQEILQENDRAQGAAEDAPAPEDVQEFQEGEVF